MEQLREAVEMDQDFDDEVEQTSEDVNSETTSNAGNTEVADNPAWNTVWEKFQDDPGLEAFLPKIKERLKPVLTEWDRDRQDLTEKYAPYKEFAEHNIGRNLLVPAYNMFAMAEQNPQQLVDLLVEHKGLTVRQAEKVVEDLQDEADDVEEEQAPNPRGQQRQVDPTVLEMQRQLQELQVERHQEQLERTMNSIEAKHKKNAAIGFIPLDKGYIATTAYNQLSQGIQPDFNKIYDNWATQVQSYRSMPAPGKTAPRVVAQGGGGGNALPLNTEDGKIPDNILRGKASDFNAWVLKNMVPGIAERNSS